MSSGRVTAVALCLAGYLALSFAQSPTVDTTQSGAVPPRKDSVTPVMSKGDDTVAIDTLPVKDVTKAKAVAPKPWQNPVTPVKPREPKAPLSEAALVDYEADVMTNRGDDIIRLIGNVHFHHNGAIIQCDSALRYDENRMDFFGRVIIEQDSTYIYGDRVNYDGRTAVADVFAPLVKMMRGDVRLYTYNFSFNTKTSIGIFSGGGVVTQTDKLMESQRGEYNANTNVVKFLDSVALRSDSYIIRTDSLSYNMDAEQATFLARTYIWDHDRDFLLAEKGDYFSRTSTYVFTQDAYAMTPDNELWADTMSYVTPVRQAFMLQNVQILDTANCTLAFGDWGFYDDSLGRAVLTDMPSVRSWEEGSVDTSYMRADTIRMLSFEPGMSKLSENEDEGMESADELISTIPNNNTMLDSMGIDSMAMDSMTLDSMSRDSMSRDSIVAIPTLIDTLPLGLPVEDSILQVQREDVPTVVQKKSKRAKKLPKERLSKKAEAKLPEKREQTDTIDMGDEPPLPTDLPPVEVLEKTLVSNKPDSSQIDSVTLDSLQLDSLQLDSLKRPKTDSLATDSLAAKPERERVMRAYHHVRMWAADYQGVCDSTVSFSVDSTAIMYGEPILWSDNNQLIANQIDVYSKDGQMDWVDFTGDPFITQQVAPGDTLQYNQASGKRLRAYFKDNEIDYAWMTSNVMNIYYMEEKEDIVAMAVISCAELTILFTDRAPSRMIWGGAGEGPIYPIEKVPETQDRFLKGFSWEEDKRPKNAREICSRTARPSFRAEAEKFHQPSFAINAALELRKADLIALGAWTDRAEVPAVTPEYFLSRDLLF